MAEATGDVIWQWRAATNRVVWTGEVRRHFGVAADRHEAESAWWHARIHPHDRERVEKSLERMMAGLPAIGRRNIASVTKTAPIDGSGTAA